MHKRNKSNWVKILALTLIIVLAARYPVVIITYHINKTFISQNLCESRIMANNLCDGKCWLKKKLLEKSKKKEIPSNDFSKTKFESCFLDPNLLDVNEDLKDKLTFEAPLNHPLLRTPWVSSILKPPIA